MIPVRRAHRVRTPTHSSTITTNPECMDRIHMVSVLGIVFLPSVTFENPVLICPEFSLFSSCQLDGIPAATTRTSTAVAEQPDWNLLYPD